MLRPSNFYFILFYFSLKKKKIMASFLDIDNLDITFMCLQFDKYILNIIYVRSKLIARLIERPY